MTLKDLMKCLDKGAIFRHGVNELVAQVEHLLIAEFGHKAKRKVVSPITTEVAQSLIDHNIEWARRVGGKIARNLSIDVDDGEQIGAIALFTCVMNRPNAITIDRRTLQPTVFRGYVRAAIRGECIRFSYKHRGQPRGQHTGARERGEDAPIILNLNDEYLRELRSTED